MENRINVDVPKHLIGLAGNDYGEELFDEIVKNKISYDKINIIVFPTNVEMIAISFVKGFFKKLKEYYGYEKFKDYVHIETSSDELTNKIMKDLGY